MKFTNGQVSPALRMTRMWTLSPHARCAGKAAQKGMRTLILQGEVLGMPPDKDEKSPRRGINSKMSPSVAEDSLNLLNIQIPWTLLS